MRGIASRLKEASGRLLSSNWFLASTLVLAATLRLAHVAALRRNPIFDVLLVDSWLYDTWAQRLAAGDWLGGPRPFYMEPLYPYFLGALYKCFGRDLLLVRLIQVGFGVASCGAVAAAGRQVAGRAAGNLAGFLLAIYKPAIFLEGEIEKTALGVFLLASATALILRASATARFAGGLALGLAALCRGNLLLFVPLAVIGVALENGLARSPQRAASMRASAGLALGAILALAPVAWRNHYVSGEWVLTTSGAGQVFYTGNNPDNATGGFVTPRFVRGHPSFEETDFKAAAEAAEGHSLTANGVSAFWFRAGLRHMLENPRFATAVALRKVALLVADFEVPDAWDLYFFADYSAVLGLPLPGMGVLLPLALVGAAAGLGRRRDALFLGGFVGAYCLSTVLFFVLARYRVYLAPALAVLGGRGLLWLGRATVPQPRGRQLAICAVAVGASLLSFLAIDGASFKPANRVHSQLNLASAYQAQGDLEAAERLIGAAMATLPDAADPVCQRGRLRASTDDLNGAQADLLRCIRLDGSYPEVWLSLGQVYLRLGRRDHAAAAFRRQLNLTPGMREAEAGLLAAAPLEGSAPDGGR